MPAEDDRKFLIEFIQVYKSLRSLWDTTSKDYADRTKKVQEYQLLVNKYKEKYPDAVKADVTKKINSLRTSYRRELRRINAVKRSGAGASVLSEPNLWYFEEISFIKTNEDATTSRSILEDFIKKEDVEQKPIKKRKNNDGIDKLIRLATEKLSTEPDNFRKIADVWASKLRQMDRMQQIYAEKGVNEILCEGLLGNLHKNSVQIVNEPPATSQVFQCVETTAYSRSHSSTPHSF